MHKLVVQPLEKSATSTVIVIDALDECKDDELASAILSVLGQFVSQILKLKFLVTGAADSRGVLSTVVGANDVCVRPPRGRLETNQQRHSTILQAHVHGTFGSQMWSG